jgi:arylsulfatase A-like enzyme
VIVLTVDTLRTDHLHHFGFASAITPVMDAFFTDGVALEAHSSCSSWTFPSFLCALSGADQIGLGFWPNNVTGQEPGSAPDASVFMAEYFQASGYYTMLASGSGFLGEAGGLDVGFDEGWGAFEPVRDARQLVDDTTSLLRDRPKDQPFFLHLHFLDPHSPYAPPVEYLDARGYDDLEPTTYDLDTEEGTVSLWAAFPELSETAQAVNLEHLRVRYAAEVAYTDEEIGRFLSFVEEQGMWEDTVLVFFVDHGEEFYEHGNFNHGYTAYDEVIRAPAAFYQPGNLAPYSVTDLTTHEDILPTLWTILGWAHEPGWTGATVGTLSRDHLFNLSYREDKTIQSVSDGHEKLIYRWGEEIILPNGEPVDPKTNPQKGFYDLDADPTEQDNLYDASDPRVIAWWEVLEPEVERLRALESGAAPENVGP